MYERILLPTDGSDGTDPAITHAFELAETYGAELHVLTVLDDASIAAASEEAMTELRDRRTKTVESLGERAASRGIDVETALREGTPQRAILSYANAAGVDMIVMGTHGRSGVGRVLLGSVTERVVREATVPVVTVRMDAHPSDVSTPAVAERRARAALEDAGHEDIRVPEEPYRTTTAWVVPAATEEGTYNVHVDASDGSTRLARIDG